MEEIEIIKAEFEGETIIHFENENNSDQELFENSVLEIPKEFIF